MTKRLLSICLLFLFFSQTTIAQYHRNEWINYSQNYYKIKVAQNGIYRIDSATLASIGVFSVDPHKFQIFHNGLQQYIYIHGETDSVLNSTDFIEFYAEKNDGRLDSLLYFNTPFVPNPYYSLINDTSAYFLTWDLSTTGRRMTPENDTTFFGSGIPAATYFSRDEVQEFHTGYYIGETDAIGGTDPRYTLSEGWFDGDGEYDVIWPTAFKTYTLNTPNKYPGGPPAKLKTVIVGASLQAGFAGTPDHHIQITSPSAPGFIIDTTFIGYSSNRFITSFPLTGITGATTDFKVESFLMAGVPSSRTATSFFNLRYPHKYDFAGEAGTGYLMYIPDDATHLSSHLNISNFSAIGNTFIYDISDARRISATQISGNYHALISNNATGIEKKCFITSDGNTIPVTSAMIKPVTPSATFTNFYNLRIDSAYIIIYNKSLLSSATNYKNYRASIAGGSYNVLMADIDELYDQFAYGIPKSPLSIKGFCKYVLDTFNHAAPPQNLFLFGKSLNTYYSRYSSADYDACLVPTFGYPASDNLFTSNINSNTYAPTIPTGRIAAKTNTSANDYLNKIIDFENPTNWGEWRKQIMHFGGGNTSIEQLMCRHFLDNYKGFIHKNLFGGNVSSFFKTSAAPVTINTSDSVTALMNSGVSLMTFFGHASGYGFDQSIDTINAYNPPAGHYPFLLANSCYSGDIHTDVPTVSEMDVLAAPHKGLVGFLGAASLGMPSALNIYSSQIYQRIDSLQYGNRIGSIIKKTIAYIDSTSVATGDTYQRNTCFSMTLHGDPALRISAGNKPDYEITGNDVTFDVTSIPDTVIVNVVRHNWGKATSQLSITQLTRTFPNGDSVTKVINGQMAAYQDMVSFHLPIDNGSVSGVGLNKFYIVLDKNHTVDEFLENNNATGEVDLIISGGDILPVYPYNFSIVSTDTVTLKASTSDAFAKPRNYIFQIDTSDKYNSPMLQTYTVHNAPGGVVKWKPAGTFLSDSTVYFWHVSPDTAGSKSHFKWREFSFQYIHNNVSGWEQAQFFQFKKENDGYQYVKAIDSLRRYDFVNDAVHLECIDGDYLGSLCVYKINSGVKYEYGWADPGWTFAIFNPLTVINKLNANSGTSCWGQYGSKACHAPGTFENAFDFPHDVGEQDSITTFLQNPAAVPHGWYVLAYTQGYVTFSSYPASVKNILIDSLGSNHISTIPDGSPYILLNKMGAPPGSAKEIVGTNATDVLHLDTLLATHWNQGFIASPVIGPAKAWHSLHYRWKTRDDAVSDSLRIHVIGINTAGHEVALADFPKTQLDVLNLGTYVDASIYPNIRLVAYMQDDVNHTPPQLKRWHVIYDPVPEAAVNPPLGYYTYYHKDTLQEGENFKLRLPIQNISNIPFTADSLLMSYWVVDASGTTHALPSKLKKKPFNVNEVIIDSISVPTIGLRGNCSLWMQANPIGKPHSQLEQYHFNNITRVGFRVSGDRINPLLDVTFDGVHILNDDIVSAKPNILIKLKDENQFLALNDTSDFKIFIQSPGSSTAQRVWFNNPYITFVPAVLPNNSCKINHTPTYLQDGQYTLIVQAKDASNNQSGAVDYQIKFEVINKATITEVMNYPNPFTTATHFVFTLTGSEIPTNFKIQIMTITGKVVREIFEDELGYIHIGRNITDYAWDGKDMYGDRLANGVYLYRVMTQLHGNDIDKRETDADQYFKKGWGKMYLMR